MATLKNKLRKPHRGVPDNRVQFAQRFIQGRLAGFAKDIQICLTGARKRSNNRWTVTHAYFPALMTCCGMLEYLAQLHVGRTRRPVGAPELTDYATKYLPQPDYSADVIRVLFDVFRDPIAHRGIASGVWVDQNPTMQGRRLTWKVFAKTGRPPMDVVADNGELKFDPPWPCRYTHRVHIHLGSLWRDIRKSADRYAADLAINRLLQDNFYKCMVQLYPH